MKKRIIVLGFPRTGTHLVKEFFYKNLNYKSNPKIRVKNKQVFFGLKRDDIFKFENNNFYIFQIWKEKKYIKIRKKELNKKYIISTHVYNNNLFKIFDKYEFLITIRNPVDAIASNISYTTKKNVILFNQDYKIKNQSELVKKKKIIKKYINNYYLFYKNILNQKKRKYILINYEGSKKKLAKIYKINAKNIELKKNILHSTKNNFYLKNYLISNYNFKKSFKIYKKILKTNQ